MSKRPVNDLIERLRTATSGSLELDYGIQAAIERAEVPPAYTRSIDAAMTLVDLDDGWLPFIELEHRATGAVWSVVLGHAAYDATEEFLHLSLPIAICMAALRATARA